MPTTDELLQSIRTAAAGLSLAELMALHPTLARRSAQRLISRMVSDGLIVARGEGRARRYYDSASAAPAVTEKDAFPAFIPLSADSKDILAYIDQPPESRKPVASGNMRSTSASAPTAHCRRHNNWTTC
jgi:hypothetical protein